MPSRNSLACLIASLLILAAATAKGDPRGAEGGHQNAWLAVRYDSNRFIVYFAALDPDVIVPNNVPLLRNDITGFSFPMELTPAFVETLRHEHKFPRFAIGDRYDLIPGDGTVLPITLTKLVGSKLDEENDLFLGALATLDPHREFLSEKNYYVVRPQQASAKATKRRGKHLTAELFDEPARFDIQSQIAKILGEHVQAITKPSEQSHAILTAQLFRLADGTLRCYARARWITGLVPEEKAFYSVGAWLTLEPSPKVLAEERPTNEYGYTEAIPRLLNVVDLGNGRTGVILSIVGEDSNTLTLAEYRDGKNSQQMDSVQTIGVGE